jgi:peptide/nickel transport system permease protein
VRKLGVLLLTVVGAIAAFAPVLALHPVEAQHRDFVLAPPMPLHVVDASGRLHAPFVHPLRLVDRLSRTYRADQAQSLTVQWFTAGRLASLPGGVPWFPLGTDSLGRDVWSRLVLGSRLSLGLALAACLGALLIGAVLGGWAGRSVGWVDDVVMRLTEFVYVLPALYVVLVLRASLPLVLPTAALFVGLALVLALVGWPTVARAVRAVVSAESASDYAVAARAAGASRARVLFVHLLPAALPVLGTQALLLAPAFIMAEATLSYVGLGFMPPTSSWGTMLQESANVRALADSPWLLSPAAALALVVLGLNLALGERAASLDTLPSRSGQ